MIEIILNYASLLVLNLCKILFKLFGPLFNSWHRVLLSWAPGLVALLELHTGVSLALAKVCALPNVDSAQTVLQTILSEAVLLVLRCAQSVQETAIHVLGHSRRVELCHVILCGLRKGSAWNIGHTVLVHYVRLEWLLPCLDAVVTHQHYTHVFRPCLGMAARNVLVAWKLNLLNSALGGRLLVLVVKASLVHNVVRTVGILVRISHLIVHISSSVTSLRRNYVCNSDVPIRLRQAIINCSKMAWRVS